MTFSVPSSWMSNTLSIFFWAFFRACVAKLEKPEASHQLILCYYSHRYMPETCANFKIRTNLEMLLYFMLNDNIFLSIFSSSGSTSGALVKTFSKSKEISENRWIKLNFLSYFNLNSEIIIWPLMRFHLAWCLGQSYRMGFLDVKWPMSYKNSL